MTDIKLIYMWHYNLNSDMTEDEAITHVTTSAIAIRTWAVTPETLAEVERLLGDPTSEGLLPAGAGQVAHAAAEAAGLGPVVLSHGATP